MAVKIKKNQSRLRHADWVSADDIEFWDRPHIPDIEKSTDDIIHVVSDGERIDAISTKYYRDPALWWVIAHANDLRILPISLIPGMKITIPDVRKLRKGILI